MRKLIFITLLFCSVFTTNAQNLILNGSFEDNMLISCTIGLSCNEFDSVMTNINSITSVSTSCSFDLLDGNCLWGSLPWGGTAHNGTWFIAAEFDSSYLERISLRLSQDLIINAYYKLSYFTKMILNGNPHPNNNTDLIIGLSNDSVSFGDTICIVSKADSIIWKEKTHVFKNTNTYNYLTIAGDISNNNSGYVLLDNFVLEETTEPVSVNELSSNNKQLLKIVDVLGREVPYKKNVPLFYIYSDGTVEKKLIIE
jgi:hypothetical protein